MWFYARGQEKSGPIPEPELRSLMVSGAVSGQDLAWTEGMPNWAPLSSIPELQQAAATPAPAPSPVAAPDPGRAAGALPVGLIGWMTFVGVINIVYGALSCLSCFGVLSGIFMIIGGSALLGAKNLLAGVANVDMALLPFFGKLKTFVQMTGIMYLITLILIVVVTIIYAGVIAAIVAGGMRATP
jgi:hypothetical protein